MKNSEAVKERILDATTALIEQSNGDVDAITTRAIAQCAGVGAGLINYHFQSKENLVTVCVQRIINRVVGSFAPEDMPDATDQERLTDWATRVFEFLFGNEGISRVSILGDLAAYGDVSNSVQTQQGFALAMRTDVKEADKPVLACLLTSAMQVAFLGGPTGARLLGYDFETPQGRGAFITRLVSILFNGIAHADNPTASA